MGKLTQFKYEQLDGETADFLRQKESNMREIVGKAYTELGKELTEARDRLAGSNQYDGVFEKWYTTVLGMNRKMVNRLIQRYELVVTNCHKQELLEDMPVSLTYEIASPSSESTPEKAQAKSEVLSGEIESLKEYRERIKELERKAEQAEQSAEIERRERERLENENAELAAQPKEIEQVYPDDYEKIKRENAEYRAKYGDSEGVRNIDDKKREKVYEEFAQELERLRLKYASIALDGANVDLYASANPEYASKINSFNDFWKMYVKTVSNDQIIIEVESV